MQVIIYNLKRDHDFVIIDTHNSPNV